MQNSEVVLNSATAPHDPRCNLFPTVASCDVKWYGSGGTLQKDNGICLLTQNKINQGV